MNTRPAVGTMLPRDLAADQVLDFVRRAEALDFDELWVVEDLGWRGGIAQAAIALSQSERLRVGVGILPAGARNAAFAAMEIATLAQVYPGRVDVGIGHGMPHWMRSVGAWSRSPLTVLETTVRTVSHLLRGDPVSFSEGEPGPVQLDPSTVPAVVPDLLLGVRGPKSLKLSGAEANGTILAEPATPEYIRASRQAIAASGRHRIVTFNAAVVDDDEAAAIAGVRPALEWIGEPDWAPHLAPLSYGREILSLREQSQTRSEFAQAMPEEWVRQLSLAGTPEIVQARIQDLGDAGATSAVLVPVGPDPLRQLDNLARAVISSR